MPCPECLSEKVEVHEYDFGICRQTGYHDAGERFRCQACGATGDADDLAAEEACKPISVGSSETAGGGGWDDCTLRPATDPELWLTR